MTYARREEERQEEQLDWLHELHDESRRQTAILERQTVAVERIVKHTGLLYVIGIIYLVALGILVLAMLWPRAF